MMIPKIKRIKDNDNHPFLNNGYMVGGKFCWCSCDTLGRAIRYWLWHCGVSARIAFLGVHPPQRPEYYKLVTIEYIDHIIGELVTANAWLAVNDDGHYIWTLDDNITVIDDDDVLDWRHM